MVHMGQVMSVLGGTSEARTVARWMAASGVIPHSTPGRDGAGRADLSRRDVAMIVLGMAAPVARRAPEHASELAQLVDSGDGRTLVEVLADALSDYKRLEEIWEVWLPMYEGSGRRSAKLVVDTDQEGRKEQRFIDMRSAEECGEVLTPDQERALGECRWYEEVVPPLTRWQCVDGAVLFRLAELFVEREGATMPVAVEEDTAA